MNTIFKTVRCERLIQSTAHCSALVAFAIVSLQLTGFAEHKKASVTNISGTGVGSHDPLRWLSPTNRDIEINGLPWRKENAPELWRLPKSTQTKVPPRVWARAVAPDGGRIRFATDTSRLSLRVEQKGNEKKRCFFDAYLDEDYAGSGQLTGSNVTDLVIFENKEKVLRQLTIYLPHNHEVRVLDMGVDAKAQIKAPRPFALKRPIVCYGSSVLQGSGAAHPSKTYPAILARRLNCDFVNLGFGGAGKAEKEVVDLVSQLDGSCFIFDLGKSYGDQTIQPYSQMLASVRKANPAAPIFCVTPIYSTKEEKEPGYREKSEKLRTLMRQAAADQRTSGDKAISSIEGLELFGPADKDFLSDPLHPGDEGNERLAQRLLPVIRKGLFPKE